MTAQLKLQSTPDIETKNHEEIEKGRRLLETLIKDLVDAPERIRVSITQGEKTTIYKIECEQRNIGQIIGSKGKNIGAVRTVISSIMARKGIRAIIEIPFFKID